MSAKYFTAWRGASETARRRPTSTCTWRPETTACFFTACRRGTPTALQTRPGFRARDSLNTKQLRRRRSATTPMRAGTVTPVRGGWRYPHASTSAPKSHGIGGFVRNAGTARPSPAKRYSSSNAKPRKTTKSRPGSAIKNKKTHRVSKKITPFVTYIKQQIDLVQSSMSAPTWKHTQSSN